MDRARAALCGTAAASLVLLQAACHRSEPLPAASPAPAEAPPPDYRAPPQVLALTRGPDGLLMLEGRAMPSSRVRLASPAGAIVETTADGSGAWTAALGPVSEPTLYGLSAETGGRRVQAEGYVAVMPGAPTVALLRAGAGASIVDGAGPGLRLEAVDFDAAGSAVLSGRARANSPLRVVVDGAVLMEGHGGADGRFSLALPKPLPFGLRRIQVLGPGETTGAEVLLAPPAPPADSPYHAEVDGLGWRIDWITPGGGPQTTLLLAGGQTVSAKAPT